MKLPSFLWGSVPVALVFMSSVSSAKAGRSSNNKPSPFGNSPRRLIPKTKESVREERLYDLSDKEGERYLVEIPIESLTPGVNVSLTLQANDYLVWSFNKSEPASFLFCETVAAEGDDIGVDLSVLHGETGMPLCVSNGLGPNQTCSAMPGLGDRVTIEVFAHSGNATNVSLMCELRPTEAIVLGTGIPLAFQAGELHYLSYNASKDSKIECILTGGGTGDADLSINTPTGQECYSGRLSSNEMCNVLTGNYSGEVNVLVHMFESKGETDNLTLRCNVCIVEPLVLGATELSLRPGEVFTFSFMANVTPALLTCQLARPQDISEVAVLSIEFENQNDTRLSDSWNISDIPVGIDIPPPSMSILDEDRTLLISLSSISDDEVKSISFNCSVTPQGVVALPELGVAHILTVVQGESLFFNVTANESPGSFHCSLTAEEGHEGDVDLVVGSNATRHIGYSREWYSNESVYMTILGATSFTVVLEGYAGNQEVDLLCNTTSYERLEFDEESNVFTLEMHGAPKGFLLDLPVGTTQVNCTVMADTFSSFQTDSFLVQETVAGGDIEVLCYAYDGEPCSANVEDISRLVVFEVFLFNTNTSTGFSDEMTVLCGVEVSGEFDASVIAEAEVERKQGPFD